MEPSSSDRVAARRRRIGPRLLAALLGASVAGCGDDDDGGGGRAPEGPPSVRIVALQPAGGIPWKREESPGMCVELGHDPDGTIDVILSENGRLDNFTLRPLYGCGGLPQCGFVLLTILQDEVPVYQVGAAATILSVPFRRLGLGETHYRVRVELRDDLGAPVVLGDAGEVVADEIPDGAMLSFLSRCDGLIPDPRDAGGDDAASDGGDARDAFAPDASPADAASDVSTDGGAPLDGGSPVDAARDAGADVASRDASPGSDARVTDSATGG